MALVFISYAREDSPFVRTLNDALMARGHETWVDWDDIPPTADWLDEVHAGIDAADAFVFVISPDALASGPCAGELAHAVDQGKRIIPVVRREPAEATVPPALAARNWIFARPQDSLEAALEAVLTAVDTDPDRVHAHSRLVVRSREWEGKGHDASLLLRGADLRAAERWLSGATPGREPEPTRLQTEYLLASRRAASRRQGITLGAALVALGVAATLGIVALLQRNEAVAQSKTARSRELAAAATGKLAIDPELSLLLADRAERTRPTAEARRALRAAIALSHVERILAPRAGEVAAARYSPDGTRIVTAHRDGAARVWDASTGRLVAVLSGHRDRVSLAVFSPAGDRILTGSRDATARIWDARSGRSLVVLRGHRRWVFRGAFGPDGRRVVTASDDHTVRVWDARTGRALAVMRGHRGPIFAASFSPYGRRVLSGSLDGTARVWDAATGRPVGILPAGAPVFAAAFSPDGRIAAIGRRDNVAVLWDLRSGRQRLLRHGGQVASVAFDPSGRRLVTGSTDGTASVWDVASGRRLARLRGHADTVYDAAWTPDGQRIVTAGGDGTARLWDPQSGVELAAFRGDTALIRNVDVSPDGAHAVTASADGTARIWDLAAGRSRLALTDHPAVSTPSFSPDGRSVWTIGAGVERHDATTGRLEAVLPDAGVGEMSADGELVILARGPAAQVRDARTGALRARFATPATINDAALSPDARLAATAGDDRVARVWSVGSGRVVAVLRGHTGRVQSVAFSPDGRRVVTASSDETARVWDAATGRPLVVLRGHSNVVNDAAFSRDGRRVVTAAWDGTARIWDADTGRPLLVLPSPTRIVTRAIFSPDGDVVLTAGADGIARVWDSNTGQPLLALTRPGRSAVPREPRLAGLGRSLQGLAFSPDGRRIVTAGLDGRADVYACDACGPEAGLPAVAARKIVRGLTPAERRTYLHERGGG